jgi:hypothetical protein
MKICFFTVVIGAILILHSTLSLATELHLNSGEIIDLGSVNSPNRNYTFDKLIMEEGSAILVPSEFSDAKITINKLETNGVAYIYVHDQTPPDEKAPPKPPKANRATDCSNGSPGRKGEKGRTRYNSTSLDITIGFNERSKLIILAQGTMGGPAGVGGDGQDGGHAGGRERCVINRCWGGDGGAPGNPGDPGDGAPGSNVTLNFSNLNVDDIELINTEPNGVTLAGRFMYEFAKALEKFNVREKQIDSHPQKSEAFLSFKKFNDHFKAMNSVFNYKMKPIDSFLNKRVVVINSGGAPGSSAQGGSGGLGGDGYFCTIGPDQAQGKTNFQMVGNGNYGKYGASGYSKLNKLD